MDELIKRLRLKGAQDYERSNHYVRRMEIERSEAAAALAEAQAEIARLRGALTSIAENPLHGELMMDVIKRKMHTARAALEPRTPDTEK